MRSRVPLRARCRLRPILEGLEGRELPSAPVASTPAVVAQPDSPNGLLGKLSSGNFLDPRILQQVADTLYPATSAPGTPTPDEVRRETFTARWVGQYTVGPPRFSGSASTIHLYGVSGGSNQFLKGKFDIAIFPPADPSATPTPGDLYANQITGIASLFGQNYLQSGAMLVLDLNGTPTAGAATGALPTELTWTYDNNTSGGPYAAPGGVVPGSGYTEGAGVMELRWKPDAHPQPGTSGSGQVVITFQGLINTSQIVSGISKDIS